MGCVLCPNFCNIDKEKRTGFCGTDGKIRIAKFYLHPFEEPCVSGKNGSGTVFFCGCNLRCAFCQNYELSRAMRGKTITESELADIFRELEQKGAHNINLVSPTQFSDKIINALKIYKPRVPVVYNTNGYENVEILEKLCDYVDVFLPDLKFYSPLISKRYCGKEDYFEKAFKAILFMANKPLIFDKDGMITSGTIVRHLVLPQGTVDSMKILDELSVIKDKIYLNVMSQYTPFGDLKNLPELNRKITRREYEKVLDYAMALGFTNMFYQKYKSADEKYIPEWDF